MVKMRHKKTQIWFSTVHCSKWCHTILSRASDRSRKKVKFRGIFWNKVAEKSADFAGISPAFSGQTWPESNR